MIYKRSACLLWGETLLFSFFLINSLMLNAVDILPGLEGTLIYFASYLARIVKHSTTHTLILAWEQDYSVVWAAFTLAFFAFLRCNKFTY